MEDKLKIPRHIAFIMDGNGRWAKKRGLPRKFGHKEGAKVLRMIVEECKNAGVEYCSFYAFSTENWKRSQDEIDSIFDLIKKFADEELDKYADAGYKVKCMGDISVLPEETRNSLIKIVEKSKNNNKMIVNLGINYGGRAEIVNAVNYILSQGLNKIDEQMLSDCMYTCNMPDPDVIVRTSGEKRLSNFMLWQSAYSEFIFIDDLWPDLKKETLYKIFEEYSKRNRRFGKE